MPEAPVYLIPHTEVENAILTHYAAALRAATAMVGASTARDVVQDAAAAVWRRRDFLNGSGLVPAYFKKTVWAFAIRSMRGGRLLYLDPETLDAVAADQQLNRRGRRVGLSDR